MWLLIPILIYSLVFIYVRHYFIYWELKGFPCENSSLRWKFLKRIWQREFDTVAAIEEDYQESIGGEKFRGIYFFFKPTLLVLDVELACHMLENAEHYFKASKFDQKQVYKKFGFLQKITLDFRQDQCRDFLKCIEGVADNMLEYLKELEGLDKKTLEVDMEETIKTYINDIMGNLLYSLKMNSFRYPNDIFNQNINKLWQSRRIPNNTSTRSRRREEIWRETSSYSKVQDVKPHDIWNDFINLRNSEFIGNKSNRLRNFDLLSESQQLLTKKSVLHLIEELLSIGLETVTTTIVHTIQQIIQEPPIPSNILQEIEMTQKTHKLYGDYLSYEALKDLQYMDNCFKETLRLHPLKPLVRRVCSRNYRIPGTRYLLAKGCSMVIPIRELQRDKRYFKDPLHFKPERFGEKSGDKPNRAYFEFDLDKRGFRAQPLLNMMLKMALTKLLQHFTLEPAVKTRSCQVAVKNSCSPKINLQRRQPKLPDLVLPH